MTGATVVTWLLILWTATGGLASSLSRVLVLVQILPPWHSFVVVAGFLFLFKLDLHDRAVRKGSVAS